MANFTASLEGYAPEQIHIENLKDAFHELKKSYKRIEYFIEYLDPELAKELNGAPIPKVAVEHQSYLNLKFNQPVFVTHPPEGLQVLEEIIFNEEMSAEHLNEALRQAYMFEEKLLLFFNNLQNQNFSDKQFIESFREQLIRVMTLGITGFDTPASRSSIENAKISLEPVLEALKLYQKVHTGPLKDDLNSCVHLLENAYFYLQEDPDFDSFDRMYFIRELGDPAYGALTSLQKALKVNYFI
ncbi:MAG: hypothetical protein M3421_01640 [Bacteroidota bacterium]|nr:hypothetical protein [Bacteroidota bacterium]